MGELPTAGIHLSMSSLEDVIEEIEKKDKKPKRASYRSVRVPTDRLAAAIVGVGAVHLNEETLSVLRLQNYIEAALTATFQLDGARGRFFYIPDHPRTPSTKYPDKLNLNLNLKLLGFQSIYHAPAEQNLSFFC